MATAPRSTASDKPKSTSDKPKSATADKPKSAAADRPRSSRATKEKTIKAKPVGIKKPKVGAAIAPGKKAKAAAVDDGKAHPSWKDMIKECIVETKERSGVSRSTIKKYIADHYHLDMSLTPNLSHLKRAISSGVEDKTFALPKGASGKVKLAPKNKPTNENESPAPVKAAPAKAAPVKKPAAAKKATPAVKKAPAKTAKAKAATTKKTSTVKTVEKKTVAAKTATAKAAKTSKAKTAVPKAKATAKPRAKKAAV